MSDLVSDTIAKSYSVLYPSLVTQGNTVFADLSMMNSMPSMLNLGGMGSPQSTYVSGSPTPGAQTGQFLPSISQVNYSPNPVFSQPQPQPQSQPQSQPAQLGAGSQPFQMFPQQISQQPFYNNCSNSDIIRYLSAIDLKLMQVNNKLLTLDTVERKINDFDKELKKIWVSLEDKTKCTDEKVVRLSDRTDDLEFNFTLSESKIKELERENALLKETIINVKSDALRDSLIIGGIQEKASETEAETTQQVREFMSNTLEMDVGVIQNMNFVEVRRLGEPRPNVNRKIMAKFRRVADREKVRKLRDKLKDTSFFMHEIFPNEIVQQRKLLIPQMLQARRDGKQSWISYNKLYVDGVAVSSYPSNAQLGNTADNPRVPRR